MKIAKNFITRWILAISLLALFVIPIDNSLASSTASKSSSEESAETGFEPGQMIIHHIKDGYKWHFFTLGDFEATLYFPVILYSADKGLVSFSSRNLYESANHKHNGFKLSHNKIKATSGAEIYDFSVTKNVVSMLVSALLMIWIFLAVAKRYKTQPNSPPKGIQSLMEPVIVFMRDEVAKPALGKDWAKYFPYIISVFFFIWINNLLGLIPGAANVTGNIAVTLCLALITLFTILFSAKKDYWIHIFNTPGVPWWLKFPIPLMPFVEAFSSFITKPVALTVRLFANITAGHILILSVISLIFIFGEINAGVGFGVVTPLSIAFTLFLYFLELLVAAVQAYIFAMLSAVFIGEAVAEHEEDEEAAEAIAEETS